MRRLPRCPLRAAPAATTPRPPLNTSSSARFRPARSVSSRRFSIAHPPLAPPHHASAAAPFSSDAVISRRRRGVAIPYLTANPRSRVSEILPGGVILKQTKEGESKEKFVDAEYGHFWAMKDIRECDSKPLLTSTGICPAGEAVRFPPLHGCTSLAGDRDVSLSSLLTAPVTLVAVSFRQYGFDQLPQWTAPFDQHLGADDTACTVRLAISEGSLLRILRPLVARGMRRVVPAHAHARTLLHDGGGAGGAEDAACFRDGLRMHNPLPGYVLLADGDGRVRWCASGAPGPGEAAGMVACARAIAQEYRGGRRR